MKRKTRKELLEEFANISPDNFPEYFSDFANARGFVESMFVMMLSQERFALKEDGTLVQATMLLGGNAVEIYLKAYLRKKGVKADDIRIHDLKKLFNLCKEKGLKNIDNPKIRNLIELFDEAHKTHQYRYIKAGEYERQLCSLPVFFDWFSALDSVITEAVGAIHYCGRSGEVGWKFPRDKPDWRLGRT